MAGSRQYNMAIITCLELIVFDAEPHPIHKTWLPSSLRSQPVSWVLDICKTDHETRKDVDPVDRHEMLQGPSFGVAPLQMRL